MGRNQQSRTSSTAPARQDQQPTSTDRFILQAAVDDYDHLVSGLASARRWAVDRARRTLTADIERLVRKTCEQAQLSVEESLPEFPEHEGSGVLSTTTALKAHKFAESFFEMVPSWRKGADYRIGCQLRLVVHGGSALKTATVLNAIQYIMPSGEPDRTMISRFVYDRLEQPYRRLYQRSHVKLRDGSATFVRQRVANGDVRVGSTPKRCFVVMPYSQERSAEVLRTFIEPAVRAAGFETARSDWEITETITDNMIAALLWDPRVIAYLGRPPWNANVMLEVGYRLAAKKPIVILRDADDDAPLPFDLRDYRVERLPARGAHDATNEVLRRIITHLREPERSQELRPHPIATVRVNARLSRLEYNDATEDAELLLQRHLSGVPVEDVVKALSRQMTKAQCRAFVREQEDLTTRVFGLAATRTFAGPPRLGRCPTATVPIVFSSHRDRALIGRSFLPIIVKVFEQGSEFAIRVMYLDVTGATRAGLDDDGNEIMIADVSGIRGKRQSMEAKAGSRSA